jgi:adenosylcobinamide-phosphate synthase
MLAGRLRTMTANPLAIAAAFVLDFAFGEPPNALHPVAWLGHVIGLGREWALRAGKLGQLVRGAAVALLVPSTSAAFAHCVLRVFDPLPLAGLVATALLVKPMFAARALRDAAYRIRDALDRDDLDGARRGLSSLCSRPADGLDREALIAATVESIAENASDSIVAPLAFFACFGLPGAVFYRAANTQDAMMGYRGRLEYAGKVAARLDDVLNLVPARATALLMLAGGALSGANVRRGAAVLLRDGARTESPNAGRPMATMAGLLGVRLEKPGHYVLGDAHSALDTTQITAAWHIVAFASVGALALCTAIAGALHG